MTEEELGNHIRRNREHINLLLDEYAWRMRRIKECQEQLQTIRLIKYCNTGKYSDE